MNTEFKPIEIIEHNWAETSIYRDGKSVCTLSIEEEATEENQEYLEIIMNEDAKVIADALTTIQSCGLLPSELLKQRDEMREMLSVLLPMFTELDSQFGKENPQERKWNENEIQTIQRISDFLESTEVKH